MRRDRAALAGRDSAGCRAGRPSAPARRARSSGQVPAPDGIGVQPHVVEPGHRRPRDRERGLMVAMRIVPPGHEHAAGADLPGCRPHRVRPPLELRPRCGHCRSGRRRQVMAVAGRPRMAALRPAPLRAAPAGVRRDSAGSSDASPCRRSSTTIRTRTPASQAVAISPPQPRLSSSGCGAIDNQAAPAGQVREARRSGSCSRQPQKVAGRIMRRPKARPLANGEASTWAAAWARARSGAGWRR